VALETEVSIVQDRSPTETALDGCPQRCWSDLGPGGRDLATSICHTQAQRSDVRFRVPEGTLVAPELKSLAFDDLLPESPFENGARLHTAHREELGELPRGAATYKRPGFI